MGGDGAVINGRAATSAELVEDIGFDIDSVFVFTLALAFALAIGIGLALAILSFV